MTDGVGPPTKRDTTPEDIHKTSPAAAQETADAAQKVAEAAQGPSEAAQQIPSGIAIMGSHPATVMAAPWDDPTWAIYACSPDNLTREAMDGRHPGLRYLFGGTRPDGGKFRVDQWFEVHIPLSDESRHYGYLRELERLPLVWMRDPQGLSMIKGARPYPQEEMERHFGPFFWTSSIAFILAKAIDDALCGQRWRYYIPLPEDIAEACGIPPEQGVGMNINEIAKAVLNTFQDGEYKFIKQWFLACLELYGRYGPRPPIPRIGIWGVMQASENEYTYQRPAIQALIYRANMVGIEVIVPKESKLFEPQRVKF